LVLQFIGNSLKPHKKKALRYFPAGVGQAVQHSLSRYERKLHAGPAPHEALIISGSVLNIFIPVLLIYFC